MATVRLACLMVIHLFFKPYYDNEENYGIPI